MAAIHITRAHSLGLPEARRIALRWAEQARAELGLQWSHAQGAAGDRVSFSRSGVSGTLAVTTTRFEINARLGFLAGVFKDRIEAEIMKNLDALMSGPAAPPAVTVAAGSAGVPKEIT